MDDVISRDNKSISEGRHAGRLHGSAAQARRSHARAMPDLVPDEQADEQRRETPMFESLGPTSTLSCLSSSLDPGSDYLGGVVPKDGLESGFLAGSL